MTARKRKQKPEVSIVGSGRLGTTLAVALARRGYPVRSLVARTLKNARKAARLLDDDVQVLAAKKLDSLNLPICFSSLFLTIKLRPLRMN